MSRLKSTFARLVVDFAATGDETRQAGKTASNRQNDRAIRFSNIGLGPTLLIHRPIYNTAIKIVLQFEAGILGDRMDIPTV